MTTVYSLVSIDDMRTKRDGHRARRTLIASAKLPQVNELIILLLRRVSWPSGQEHRIQALVFLVQQIVGSSPGRDTMSLCKTLNNYSCFSPPRGKRVTVRAEMVLVIDLA